MFIHCNSKYLTGWLSAICVYLFGFCSIALGQDPQSVGWALDDQTMAVGWINPSTADFASLRRLASELGLEERDRAIDEVKSMIEKLRTASATRIEVVVDFSAIMGQMPLLLISATDPAAVMKVVSEFIPPQSGAEIKVQGSMVMIGTKTRIDRLLGEKRSSPNAKLTEVLAGASSDHGMAIAIPSVPREMLSKILESNPNELEGQVASRIIRGMESGRFILSEKEKRFELKVEFSSPENAAHFGKLAGETIAPESRVPDKLRPTVVGNTVTWTVVGIDSMAELLKAMPMIRQAREAAKASQGMNNLKQVALAFHNFESAYRTFVPQALTSKDGRKLLSWRVMILPFIEQAELYQQFRLDEPWDSEHNIQLVDKMPKIYESAGAGKGKTAIQTPLTPKSVFGRQGKPIQFQDITDGTSNTIWLVETAPADAVIWTKPDDFFAGDEESFQKLFANREQISLGFVDGSVRRFDSKLPYKTFSELLTIDGGEVVQLP